MTGLLSESELFPLSRFKSSCRCLLFLKLTDLFRVCQGEICCLSVRMENVGQGMFSGLKISTVAASEVTHALRLRINHGCKEEVKKLWCTSINITLPIDPPVYSNFCL